MNGTLQTHFIRMARVLADDSWRAAERRISEHCSGKDDTYLPKLACDAQLIWVILNLLVQDTVHVSQRSDEHQGLHNPLKLDMQSCRIPVQDLRRASAFAHIFTGIPMELPKHLSRGKLVVIVLERTHYQRNMGLSKPIDSLPFCKQSVLHFHL